MLERPGAAAQARDVKAPMLERRVSRARRRRASRACSTCSADDLTPELAPWYPGRDAYAAQVVADGARHASTRPSTAGAISSPRPSSSATPLAARWTTTRAATHEKRAAQSRHAQAIDQLNLLQQGTSSLSSDFYTYRYLATEGFLPGYNFPRLPLMAYVPATNDGRGRQTYLQRPRFLALSEFGPRSLVYHEGRAYRVVRALLSLGHRDSATPTRSCRRKTVRICTRVRRRPLHRRRLAVPRLRRVARRRRDRQPRLPHRERRHAAGRAHHRQRRGATAPGLRAADHLRVGDARPGARRAPRRGGRRRTARSSRLAYGPGATITRLNKGLRRRANRTQFGFRIDPVSGYWAKNEDEGEAPIDPTASPRQWIVPSVQDRKNALLLQPRGR